MHFLMIFATDIPHFKCTFHKQFIHLHTFDYYLRSEMFLKCSSYTEYRNEIGCFTNFNIYHSWWHSPFLRKKVIMIRKLSISRSTYLLKRRVSFLLITTGYNFHVFFFTTECCDFGDRQPCINLVDIFHFLSDYILLCFSFFSHNLGYSFLNIKTCLLIVSRKETKHTHFTKL